VLGEFDYVRPRSVDEACGYLAESDDARVLAGGTDLLVDIRNGLRAPRLLIDIKPIDALDRLDADGRELKIGAAVPLNRIAEHHAVRLRLPALADAALSIGTYQIRNRATLAGNLCNGSPAADTAPVLLTLGAVLAVAGPDGQRAVPVSDLFTGVKQISLGPAEIVTAVCIPVPGKGTRTAFLKQQRIRGHDLAIVNAAGTLAPGKGALRVAVGSCAPTPLLLEPVDANGGSVGAIADRIIERAEEATCPISDVRASAAYRSAVLRVLLRRLVERLLDGGGGS